MRPLPAVLFYDARCTLCRGWAEWIALGGSRSLILADANDEPLARQLGVTDTPQLRHRMCLLREDGAEVWGYDAIVELAGMSAGSRGLARIMGAPRIRRLGWRLYELVARSRPCAASA